MGIKFQPLEGYLLIEPIEQDTGGIALPPDDKSSKIGKVVLSSSERYENFGIVPIKVAAGDIVYYPAFAGQKIRIEGEQYTVLLESECYGYYREKWEF